MGCRLTNFALNTNADCFGRRLCFAIPNVPTEYTVTYLLYFFPLPVDKHLLSSYSSLLPPPPSPTGTVLSLCLEADRCRMVGSDNLWGVISGSPSPHFLRSASLRGCHSGPDRWKRKERDLCTTHSVTCHVSVCKFCRLEIMGTCILGLLTDEEIEMEREGLIEGRERTFFSENLPKNKIRELPEKADFGERCGVFFRDNDICTCACLCVCTWLCVKQLNADVNMFLFPVMHPVPALSRC